MTLLTQLSLRRMGLSFEGGPSSQGRARSSPATGTTLDCVPGPLEFAQRKSSRVQASDRARTPDSCPVSVCTSCRTTIPHRHHIYSLVPISGERVTLSSRTVRGLAFLQASLSWQTNLCSKNVDTSHRLCRPAHRFWSRQLQIFRRRHGSAREIMSRWRMWACFSLLV